MKSHEEYRVKWLIDKPGGLLLNRRRLEPTPSNRFLLPPHELKKRFNLINNNKLRKRKNWLFSIGLSF